MDWRYVGRDYSNWWVDDYLKDNTDNLYKGIGRKDSSHWYVGGKDYSFLIRW